MWSAIQASTKTCMPKKTSYLKGECRIVDDYIVVICIVRDCGQRKCGADRDALVTLEVSCERSERQKLMVLRRGLGRMRLNMGLSIYHSTLTIIRKGNLSFSKIFLTCQNQDCFCQRKWESLKETEGSWANISFYATWWMVPAPSWIYWSACQLHHQRCDKVTLQQIW